MEPCEIDFDPGWIERQNSVAHYGDQNRPVPQAARMGSSGSTTK